MAFQRGHWPQKSKIHASGVWCIPKLPVPQKISGQFFFDQTASVPGKWVGFQRIPGSTQNVPEIWGAL